MVADNPAILPDLDPVVIGADLDRAAKRTRRDRVLVVVEPYEAGLGDRGRHGMEAVEAARIGHERRPLGLEHLPHGPIPELGVGWALA